VIRRLGAENDEIDVCRLHFALCEQGFCGSLCQVSGSLIGRGDPAILNTCLFVDFAGWPSRVEYFQILIAEFSFGNKLGNVGNLRGIDHG